MKKPRRSGASGRPGKSGIRKRKLDACCDVHRSVTPEQSLSGTPPPPSSPPPPITVSLPIAVQPAPRIMLNCSIDTTTGVELKQKVNELTGVSNELKAAVLDQRATRAREIAVKREHDTTRGALAALHLKHHAVSREAAQRERKVASMERWSNNLKEAKVTLEGEVLRLRGELNTAKSSVEKTEAELSEKRDALAAATADAEAARSETDGFKKFLEKSDAQVARLKLAIEARNTSSERARDRVATAADAKTKAIDDKQTAMAQKRMAERASKIAATEKEQAVKAQKEAERAECASRELISKAEARVTDVTKTLNDIQRTVTALSTERADLNRTVWRANRRIEQLTPGETRGRPKGVAGMAELNERWLDMNKGARYKALARHSKDVYGKLDDAGTDNWIPDSLATALDAHGLVDTLWETKPFRNRRMSFTRDLRDILQAEWSVPLAIYAKNDLGMSDRNYNKLRLAFSHVYKDGGWRRRVWYTEPITGEKVFLPEPLVSRYKWFPVYKAHANKFGLNLSEDGKVSSRGFCTTLRTMLRRDAHLLRVPTKERPWHPCFGIDATSISARREFTHAGITIGGLMKMNSHFSSELRLMSLAVGQYHDNAAGINAIIGADAPTAIADEFSTVAESGELDLEEPLTLTTDDGGEVEVTCAPCEPVICLDLAAARAMRQCKGKTACVCNCVGKAGLQGCPGVGGRAEMPEGDDEATWLKAEELLKADCGYGSEIMSYASLQMACHVVPDDFDWSKGGWRCTHAGCAGRVVFANLAAYAHARVTLKALREAAAEDDVKAKELKDFLKEHADGHLDAILFGIIVIRVGTDRYIIDPLHALELNVGKVCWKWSFTNQMDDKGRERVAAFLDSIGLPLDVREKGKRDRQQKWFSASGFDAFVLGKEHSEKSKSLGLAGNIWEVIHCVYHLSIEDAEAARLQSQAAELQKRAAASEAAAAAAAAAAAVAAAASRAAVQKRPKQSRRNRQAPVGGFQSSTAPTPPPPPIIEQDEKDDSSSSSDDEDGMEHLTGYDKELDEGVEAFIKSKFGSKYGEVFARLWLWEAYDELFRAWRDEWTSDSRSYRARRALRMLRAGIALQKALNVVSLNQHQSWYVHYMIYIVPRQMWQYGNTWRYSTAPIESRGARLKRLGRTTVSWRVRAIGRRVYDYLDLKGNRVVRSQGYDSSASHQLLQKVCMSEDFWHANSSFTRPEHLRLQQHARATRIKLEPTAQESDEGARSMMSMLRTAIMVLPTPRPNFDSPAPPAAPQASPQP